jgi:hypothetical protein
LARHDGDLRDAAGKALSLDELVALVGDAREDGPRSREDAIACYLSGSQGWRDAVRRLGGAFAEDAEGLKERKVD